MVLDALGKSVCSEIDGIGERPMPKDSTRQCRTEQIGLAL